MTDLQYKDILTRFSDYTNRFFEGSPINAAAMDVKRKHCYRVSSFAKRISESLGDQDSIRNLMQVAGLFHDVGRFEQLRQFGTFMDAASVDHGDFGSLIVEKEGFFEGLEASEISILENCIRYHNKLELPTDTDLDHLRYIKLIRDADKLDIFAVLLESYTKPELAANKVVQLGLNDSEDISDSIFESFANGKMPRYEDMRTLNDFKVLNMSWVFDLNYNYSFMKLNENDFLGKLYGTMPQNEKCSLIYTKAKNYLDKKLREYD